VSSHPITPEPARTEAMTSTHLSIDDVAPNLRAALWHPPASPVQRRYLSTREASLYCGFKTTGALRKALLEGRIRAVGRRGGTGTLMWERGELDRFLRGEPMRKGDEPETEPVEGELAYEEPVAARAPAKYSPFEPPIEPDPPRRPRGRPRKRALPAPSVPTTDVFGGRCAPVCTTTRAHVAASEPSSPGAAVAQRAASSAALRAQAAKNATADALARIRLAARPHPRRD
jgi:hypothetical protein